MYEQHGVALRAVLVMSLIATIPTFALTLRKAEVPVYSRSSGKIQQLFAFSGEHVLQRQLIAKLDSTGIDQEIEIAEMRAAAIRGALAAAQRSDARGRASTAAERSRWLRKKHAIESDLIFLRIKRASMEFRAPLDGRLRIREASKIVGEYTQPGDILFYIETADMHGG